VFLDRRNITTYQEFKIGLFIKYHFVYLKSTPFIKFNQYHSDTSAVFEDSIILKIDAERVLKTITNRNMVEAFCLIAQGYMQWEIGEMLGKSEGAIEDYVTRIKSILKNNKGF
jgi:hypothetical protein